MSVSRVTIVHAHQVVTDRQNTPQKSDEADSHSKGINTNNRHNEGSARVNNHHRDSHQEGNARRDRDQVMTTAD